MRALSLQYPPSLNRYYRTVKGRILISKAGREYRNHVVCKYGQTAPALTGRLAVVINVYPPDNRRRDLDNLCKRLLDALQHAGIYEDDSQIDKLTIERKGVGKPGGVDVLVRTIVKRLD